MLNDARPIVPPMKNVVGNTHAETRLEIEARTRAEQAAKQAELAALEQKANKKSPVSTVLALVFGFIALGAIGFSVYELLENNKLQSELQDIQARYNQASTRNDELSEANSKLRQRNAALEEELEAMKNNNGDSTDETSDETDDTIDNTDDTENEMPDDSSDSDQ